MHKARNFGNQNNRDFHDVRDLDTALQRMKLAGAFFFTIPGPKMLWQFGELGYGWNDGECVKPGDGSDGDCRPQDPGRTAEKPVRWDYYEDENRFRLYRSWGELIRLRNTSPVFTSSETEFSSSLRGDTKWIRLEHDDMDVLIVGNFGVDVHELNAVLPYAGEWYEFITGKSEQFNESSVTFSLAPAEFRIYTSDPVEPAEANVFFKPGEDGFTGLPERFELRPNYPNPFNPSTNLTYEIPAEASVRINVYDILGRQVATLVNEDAHRPGIFTITFDANSLSSGVYLARLISGSTSIIQKMTFVK